MKPWYPAAVLAIAALITGLTRALPFLLFGKRKELPGLVRYLGSILPAALMAVLMVYCLRDLPSAPGPSALFQLASLAVVVLVHFWKHNTLLSISAGTGLYMLLLRLPI